MKPTYTSMAALLAIALAGCQSYTNDANPELVGPYLGQQPPGDNAELFAPGIITTKEWGDAGKFSPDMNEFYLTRWRVKDNKTERFAVTYKLENNSWQAFEDPNRKNLPTFSPDGNTKYFKSHYQERTKSGWSEQKSLGKGFEDIRIMGVSASNKGTLVFDEWTSDGSGTLRYSTLVNGKWQAPTPLDKKVFNGKWIAHPYIAPDESYIMWDSEMSSGYGQQDLWISFKLQDGTWGQAINLGERVNTDAEEGGPQVTPDGKFLFFNRMVPSTDGKSQSDLFWIDASFLDELKPSNAYKPTHLASEQLKTKPFREIPLLKQAYFEPSPTYEKDKLEVGKLGADGGNKDAILKLAKEIEQGKHGKYDSFLIAHKDKLLFESYYLRGRANLPHFQASATKAYTGLALGRAIQLGYLTMADLNKPLVSFLSEINRTKLAKGAEKITLHKALTMRSGLQIPKEHIDALTDDSNTLKGQKHLQAMLEHSKPITPESQVFKYSYDPKLVMQVLEAVVPGGAEHFIKTELFDKLGITNYIWPSDVNDLPRAGSHTKFTSRDMVKIGLLAKNRGLWQGQRLIPKIYIEQAMDRIVLTGDEDVHFGGPNTTKQGYGYYWWSADLEYNGKKYFARSAQGGWGQLITIIDELDLVVVTTAHDNDANYLQLIAEQVLPAFIQ